MGSVNGTIVPGAPNNSPLRAVYGKLGCVNMTAVLGAPQNPAFRALWGRAAVWGRAHGYPTRTAKAQHVHWSMCCDLETLAFVKIVLYRQASLDITAEQSCELPSVAEVPSR
jgi:hypothetical protein